jgi:hypothetical protein
VNLPRGTGPQNAVSGYQNPEEQQTTTSEDLAMGGRWLAVGGRSVEEVTEVRAMYGASFEI